MPMSGLRSCSRSRTVTSWTVWPKHYNGLNWKITRSRITLIVGIDSIFFDNDRTLFATFKYIGTDYDGDMEKMRANPKVREWWAMTDGMQVR
jgi:hypothetical protein